MISLTKQLERIMEYEVKFERWNILNRVHEVKYDYFKAQSVQEAKNQCYWKYGNMIDFLNIEVFVE